MITSAQQVPLASHPLAPDRVPRNAIARQPHGLAADMVRNLRIANLSPDKPTVSVGGPVGDDLRMSRFEDWRRAHPVQARLVSAVLFGLVMFVGLAITDSVGRALAVALIAVPLYAGILYLVIDRPRRT